MKSSPIARQTAGTHRLKRSRQRVAAILAMALLLAFAITLALFLRDNQRAHQRVQGRSHLAPTPYGDMEYTVKGTGPPVLVIHGAGGGFDQGELIARYALPEGFKQISPSRFGYLRSALPDDATWDMQAAAYRTLLDYLDFERVAVLAISQGCPSALLFAARFPHRVTSLALISCGVATLTDPAQQQANLQGDLLANLFRYDLLYWLSTRLFESQFVRAMGADEEVYASLSPRQRSEVRDFIRAMNPVSLRTAGAAFDNRAQQPGDRIHAVQAPAILFHAKDDTLQLFAQAEFAARTLPNAELIAYPRGGHLLLLVEQQDIRNRIKNHFARD
jgi:2-hydroxy-6-oxonona-2,4-dienedioate hydrolase